MSTAKCPGKNPRVALDTRQRGKNADHGPGQRQSTLPRLSCPAAAATRVSKVDVLPPQRGTHCQSVGRSTCRPNRRGPHSRYSRRPVIQRRARAVSSTVRVSTFRRLPWPAQIRRQVPLVGLPASPNAPFRKTAWTNCSGPVPLWPAIRPGENSTCPALDASFTLAANNGETYRRAWRSGSSHVGRLDGSIRPASIRRRCLGIEEPGKRVRR